MGAGGPFATLADYEARYGAAEDPERARVYLEDASAYVLSRLPEGGEGMPATLANLPRVTCAVAARAMAQAGGTPGVESWQQGAGPFSVTVKAAGAAGDMYLLASERDALGIGGSLGFSEPRGRKGGGDG